MYQEYTIEENENYPTDSIFLMRGTEAVGDARRHPDGYWLMTISQPYDPETDTDCRVIGWASSKSHAAAMLLAAVE